MLRGVDFTTRCPFPAATAPTAPAGEKTGVPVVVTIAYKAWLSKLLAPEPHDMARTFELPVVNNVAVAVVP